MTQMLWGSATESFCLDFYKQRLRQECDLQFGPTYDWTDKETIAHDVNIILSRLAKDITEFAEHCNTPVKVVSVFYGKLCIRYLSVMVKKLHDQHFESVLKSSSWGGT